MSLLAEVNYRLYEKFGSWRVSADISKAGMLAVRKIKEYLENGVTFNQETTLCGHMILKNIERAKQLGYEIDLNYVGLDSVEAAKERVAIRVKNGGHGIPEEDIERRDHISDRIHCYDRTDDCWCRTVKQKYQKN